MTAEECVNKILSYECVNVSVSKRMSMNVCGGLLWIGVLFTREAFREMSGV